MFKTRVLFEEWFSLIDLFNGNYAAKIVLKKDDHMTQTHNQFDVDALKGPAMN